MPTVKSVCGGCHNSCPILVEVENGRVVRTSGVPGDPRTGGAICSKGQAGPQIAHDPRRLMYPVARTGERGEGKWERLDWDDAIARLAGKINAAVASEGPRSVGFIRGQAPGWGFTYDMTQRLAHAVGTDVGMGASECFVPRAVMEGMTYGGMPSHCDYDNADLLIFWGKQPAFSVAPSLRKIYDAHERGARLVCVDPLHFHLAATADEVLQPEPGTDLAIMLAMIYVIVEEGLWDAEFVDSYTNDPGLKRLAAHVRGANRQGIPYTPEWAEGISGVPATATRSLAVEYATTKHAGIVSGHGLEGRVNVSQTTRALCILRTITGHLDRVGCDVFTPKSPDRDPNFTLIDRVVPGFSPAHPTKMFHVPPYNHPDSSWPLLFGGQGLIPTPDMYRLMREGKLKVAVIQGANIMVTQPQPDVTRVAMANVDFICVIDPYLSETAELADLVLPAATYLERTEPEWFKSDVWLPIVTLRQKCVTVGEALPDTQIMIRLGRALGFDEEFPTEEIDYYIDEDLAPSGITAAQPAWDFLRIDRVREVQEGGFQGSWRQGQHLQRGARGKRLRSPAELDRALGIPPCAARPRKRIPVRSLHGQKWPHVRSRAAPHHPLASRDAARALPVAQQRLGSRAGNRERRSRRGVEPTRLDTRQGRADPHHQAWLALRARRVERRQL